MLEHSANQAAGLLVLRARMGPRLLAVVSHGDEAAELPFLWRLCIALINFGYGVTVLDATTNESDTNPGLQQLLNNGPCSDRSGRASAAWTVLPAGNGVNDLIIQASGSKPSLEPLGDLFSDVNVVVLYCRVDAMISLVGHTFIEPLLAVSSKRNALLTSYLALKRLLITGKLTPTIINMVQENPQNRSQPISSNLGECAQRFLGHSVKSIEIAEQLRDDGPGDPLHGLALRLVEGALPLGSSSDCTLTVQHPVGSLSGYGRWQERANQFAGSH